MKIIFLFIFVLIGCASPSDKKFIRVDVDMFYRQNGVVKYILSPLPSWANVHEDSMCRRSKSVKYLDLNALNKSFGLTYEQTIAFQYIFDEDYYTNIFKAQKDLTLQEEEQVFFSAQDKIKANLRLFNVPKSETVNIVLIDNYLLKPKEVIERLLNSDEVSQARPVLFSFCHTRTEILKMMSKMNVNIDGLPMLTYESLSYYANDFSLGNYEMININEIVGSSKKINVFTTNESISKSINGKYKKIIFK